MLFPSLLWRTLNLVLFLVLLVRLALPYSTIESLLCPVIFSLDHIPLYGGMKAYIPSF